MIKREVFFEYWNDTAITTIKERIPLSLDLVLSFSWV